MLCWGSREKELVTKEQRWDYINLSDFKTRSCWTSTSYVWLWVLIITSIAVYVVDIFTAVNLLAFDQFAGVQPKISFDISKWIFATCIILSFIFLGFEWFRAIGVIRRGSVAESYLDPLAVILQSIRVDKNGRGYKRFLVFAELTKSRKGIDYAAIFVYFQFKGALFHLIAEGPRIVINAFTLYAVLDARLIKGKDDQIERSNFDQFWYNVQVLYEKNPKEALIYMSMLFTLVVWVIFTIMLIIAVIIYVLFLWRHIPRSDRRLSRYCRRKVDARLDEIVNKTIRKALSKESAKSKENLKKGSKDPDRKLREPTLPRLSKFGDSRYEPSVHSIETQGTLPPYLSRSGTGFSSVRSAEPADTPPVPSMEHYPRPGMLPRSATFDSDTSNVSSKASLLHQAADMGHSEDQRPFSRDSSHGVSPYSSQTQDYGWPMNPTAAPTSNCRSAPLTAGQQSRPASPFGQPYNDRSHTPTGSQGRTNSPLPYGHAYSNGGRASPAPSGRRIPFGPVNRAYTQSPLNTDGYGRASPAPGVAAVPPPRNIPNRTNPHAAYSAYPMEPIQPRSYTPSQNNNQQYAPYNPNTGPALRSETQLPPQAQQQLPRRMSPTQHVINDNVGSLSSSPPPPSPIDVSANASPRNNHGYNLRMDPYGSAYGPTLGQQANRRSSIGDLLDSYGERT